MKLGVFVLVVLETVLLTMCCWLAKTTIRMPLLAIKPIFTARRFWSHVFGREGQEPVLVAFLNAVLKPTEGKQIRSLTYTNTELTKANAEDKKATLDIRAEIQDGRHVNIEVQLENEHNMAKRSLYYWAELYSRQMVLFHVEFSELSVMLYAE